MRRASCRIVSKESSQGRGVRTSKTEIPPREKISEYVADRYGRILLERAFS